MEAWNLFDHYYLHLTQVRFLDWVSVLVTLKEPHNTLGFMASLLFQVIVWNGFLGALFAQMLTVTTSYGVVYKAVIFSLILWFVFKIVVNLYQVPILSGIHSVAGALSGLGAIILWGLTLGFALKRLDRYYGSPG